MREKKNKKDNKIMNIIITVFVVLLVILFAMFAVLFIMVQNGKKKLDTEVTSNLPMLDFPIEEETDEELEEGQILYQGQKYQYNKDIKSFVIMGIDTMDSVEELIESPINGGQSDMNFVAVMNPHTRKIQLIAINRNTMTTIYCYTEDGTLTGTKTGQITLQHAYGSGGKDSCEMMVSAIDNILYMIPIHGYFAMNMGAITKLNDAIGGVELTAIQDVAHKGTNIKKGEKILLKGNDAFWYTKYRDWTEAGSADQRLERQKQYLYQFFQQLKKMVKQDMTLPLSLYKIIEDYSVTDLSLDKISYLASQLVNYDFDTSDIYSVPGESVTSDVEYEEFYVDDEALYEMIIEIFYEPVN